MQIHNKATRIRLADFRSPQMRAFHLSWMAFFLCFFGWFGIAPLMAVVREDLSLTNDQIGNLIIASVLVTVFGRIIIGPLVERFGPRRVYTGLLALGAIPVMSIGLADSYESFLLARLAIGVIGASFVLTQFHCSVMFAPNVVGLANATTAGWGNAGGGATQMLMPLIFAGIVALGVPESLGWRLAMVVPGVVLLVMAALYWFGTQDAPDGNFDELRARGALPPVSQKEGGGLASLKAAATDYRVWALFFMYGACFGVELTIHNVAALYYFDQFGVSLKTAGLLAGIFGILALFARAIGGWGSDRLAQRLGLPGRVWLLFGALLLEGLLLMLFSQMQTLWLAVLAMIGFGLFTHISCGAVYGLVPFVNRQALGSVAGLVGAGGNMGAVAAGLLFKVDGIGTGEALLFIGFAVTVIAFAALAVRFSAADRAREEAAFAAALAQKA